MELTESERDELMTKVITWFQENRPQKGLLPAVEYRLSTLYQLGGDYLAALRDSYGEERVGLCLMTRNEAGEWSIGMVPDVTDWVPLEPKEEPSE